MKKIVRIGAGSAWWGDRIEPAKWNAERGDLDYLCFETMAEATISAAQVRKRPRSFVSRLRHLSRRPHAGGTAGLHQARHQDHHQPGLDQSRRGGRAHRLLAEKAGRERHQGRVGQRQPDHRPRIAAHRQDPRERQADFVADRQPGVGGGLPRRGADRRGVAARRAHRGLRPRRRSVYFHGADDVRVRLGRARPRPPRRGQRPRPPDGMRRASHRRLFLGPRFQGCAGTLELRLPDRRSRSGRLGGADQGFRQRRRRQPDDGKRADALRGPRPGELHHARRRRRFHHRQARAERAGPGTHYQHFRQTAHSRP